MRGVEPQLPVHGGDALAVARRLGLTDVLDFSANINPLGPPDAVLQLFDRERIAGTLGAYPDRSASGLTGAIRERYGVAEDRIVVANGSAALLDALLRAIGPATCLIPTPAFSEYRRAVDAAGQIFAALPLDPQKEFGLQEDVVMRELERVRPGALLITNPHNPSGTLTQRSVLARIVRAARATNTLVILDEAFVDYVPNESLMSGLESIENLVVVRSLTKFYAMPALRVGYLVASPELARRIVAFVPSWPVTTLALDAAQRALGDEAYDRRTIAENAIRRETLAEELRALGFRVVPSVANFLLAEVPASWGDVATLCERLVRSHGILLRNCADYDGLRERRFVRIAVKDAYDNGRLLAALANQTPARNAP